MKRTKKYNQAQSIGSRCGILYAYKYYYVPLSGLSFDGYKSIQKMAEYFHEDVVMPLVTCCLTLSKEYEAPILMRLFQSLGGDCVFTTLVSIPPRLRLPYHRKVLRPNTLCSNVNFRCKQTTSNSFVTWFIVK